MLSRLKALNDRAALALAAAYGSALTIWTFAGYSLIGAFVPDSTLATMLYWSNAAQLVFCPLSVYVGKLMLDKQGVSHAKHDELAAKVDAIHDHIKNTGGV